ncbi:MAG: tetratricopeptide repeat protein [Candidatus Poribacteria bacterium]|nr:tetratricopeptide repeat protein [Candidatus Poribacteria bacterium]
MRLNSPDLRIRDADRKFDAAVAFRITADKDTEQEKRHEQVEQRKLLYDEVLSAYRAIVKAEPTGKLAQRSLWQIAEIYRRRYEWDKVVEIYNAIIAIEPSTYYGERAKSAKVDSLKYRRLIDEKRGRIHKNGTLYAEDNAPEHYRATVQALYDVAESFEQLGDYPEAITYYQRIADEFPDDEKAPAALTKIGEIHFYKLYEYQGGWPAHSKVIEIYPDSYEATQAVRIVKETHRELESIFQYREEIGKHRYENTEKSYANPRKMFANQRYRYRQTDLVVQAYQIIARRWEDLRNYPMAIATYRELAGELPYKRFAAADARYQIGRLYQLNGQLDQAIDAYQELFDNNPESMWCAEGIYQQAVCYREVREFTKAYEGFKEYMKLGRDVEYYHEAERAIRELETDKDGDWCESEIEQKAGTTDQDPIDHRGVKSFLIRLFQGNTENRLPAFGNPRTTASRSKAERGSDHLGTARY